MNGLSIIERMRGHFATRVKEVGDDAPLGVWACAGKETEVEGDDRTLRLTATTSDVDLDGEVVVPDGADTSYFFANRAIFVDHQYDVASVVGRLRSASLRPGKGWLIRVDMMPRLEGNPLSSDILTMAKAGAAPGTSIGFIATDYSKPTDEEKALYGLDSRGSVVRKWKWLENSLTFMPCNVGCQTLDARELVDDRKMGVVDNLLCKGLIRRESAVALGFPDKSGPKRVVIKCVA